MDNFKGLAHIGVYVQDIEKSKSFYIENLGFKLVYETRMDKPDNQWLKISFVKLGEMTLELLEPSDKSGIQARGDGIVDHLAIEVKNLQDLVKGLKEKGIVFDSDEPGKIGNLFNGVQVIFFRGPNGERLELFEYLD